MLDIGIKVIIRFLQRKCTAVYMKGIYMDLNELRSQIDRLDSDLLSVFCKRMELCRQVAQYKKEHDLPVFQEGREQAIIEKVREKSPERLKDASAVFFTEIMDISKSLQQNDLYRKTKEYAPGTLVIDAKSRIGCQGTAGSNSETAARKLFKDNDITFFHDFESVFRSVESGETDFGIIPIHNSTAGSVTQTYDLMRKYDLYIVKTIKIEITNCLAVKPGTDISSIKKVYSHPQALSQCSSYISQHGYKPVESINTANAAEYVSQNGGERAAICSENCAALYGMEIADRGISNVIPNYTKFICISKKFLVSDDADTISVNLRLSNSEGSLYRLLSKFFISNMNLSKIENRPVADGSFDVLFYLDFDGNVKDNKVTALLSELSQELEYFKFLGNFSEI